MQSDSPHQTREIARRASWSTDTGARYLAKARIIVARVYKYLTLAARRSCAHHIAPIAKMRNPIHLRRESKMRGALLEIITFFDYRCAVAQFCLELTRKQTDWVCATTCATLHTLSPRARSSGAIPSRENSSPGLSTKGLDRVSWNSGLAAQSRSHVSTKHEFSGCRRIPLGLHLFANRFFGISDRCFRRIKVFADMAPATAQTALLLPFRFHHIQQSWISPLR